MLSMPNLLNFEYHALMLNGINMKSLYEKMHFFKFFNIINVNAWCRHCIFVRSDFKEVNNTLYHNLELNINYNQL